MPLQLGDASHERAQLVVWDTQSVQETLEASKKSEELQARGFTISRVDVGRIELLPPARNPNQGMFRILSQNGDDHVVWDRRDANQVREAYKKFKELKDKGYTAFATTSDGKKGHRIDDFDPSLEEIILVPNTMPG
jgi:hypothetical protein